MRLGETSKFFDIRFTNLKEPFDSPVCLSFPGDELKSFFFFLTKATYLANLSTEVTGDNVRSHSNA